MIGQQLKHLAAPEYVAATDLAALVVITLLSRYGVEFSRLRFEINECSCWLLIKNLSIKFNCHPLLFHISS